MLFYSNKKSILAVFIVVIFSFFGCTAKKTVIKNDISLKNKDKTVQTNDISTIFKSVDNIRFASLSENRYFVAFVDDSIGTIWGLIKDNRFHFLVKSPGISFFKLDSFLISPDERYMLTLSVGEGHPILEIFEIEMFFNFEGNEELIDPIFSLNPYPLWANFEEWKGDNIILSSEIDLTKTEDERVAELEKESSDSKSEVKLFKFSWSVKTGELKRVE
ncbi:hypothetical protein JXR93_13095 [bacterium]|nr:hypothetical protein [bacterium]